MRNKIIYWTLTILVLAPTIITGIIQLFTELNILGLAKVLVALAILTERFPNLKHLAYAVFMVFLLAMAAIYALSKDYMYAAIYFARVPMLLVSYFYWNRINFTTNNVTSSPIGGNAMTK